MNIKTNNDQVTTDTKTEAVANAPIPNETSVSGAAQQPVTEEVELSRILTDDQNHPREHIDTAVVEDYVTAMKANVEFPAIEIFKDGGKYWLADGRHRLEAAKLAGKPRIFAKVFNGSRRDAILHSLQANAGHGMRRSNADKRKAVIILLNDTEWQVWNDSRIARQCNVSQDLVAAVRGEMAAENHHGKENDDTGARLVSRGGKAFLQKRKAGSSSLPEHIAAIGEMRELARKACATAPDSDTGLSEVLLKVGADLHEILGRETKAECRLTEGLREPLNVYTHKLESGIKETPEFEKKGLATHSLNVGLGCGHQCTYCSAPSLRYRIPAYGELKIGPYDRGFAVIDVEPGSRIRKAMPKLDADNTIMLSTLDDAWSPEALKYGIGRTCLETLLKETSARIRILTKNAGVMKDFDVAKGNESRVIVGLSTGIPVSREGVAAAVEPNASAIKDRLATLKQAHELGFATYGMLCPCLPGIADSEAALTEMFNSVLDCGVEDIWLEPVNARGKALSNTAVALRLAGLKEEAASVDAIRREAAWSPYATKLTETAVKVAQKLGAAEKLHILLYQDSFSSSDVERLNKLGTSVIWLGKAVSKTGQDAGPTNKAPSPEGAQGAAA